MTRKNKSSGASGSNNKDMEFKSWANSMHMMLGCIGNSTVEACSISVVPEQVRKSKVEAYTPRKVSIGPLHRGACPDLLYMEDIKWRHMKQLLLRTTDASTNVDPTKRLQMCSKAILDLFEILRASYNVDDIKFNNYDLSKILLLDGCFLLELLIRESERSNDIPERELVLSDLTVLGNQIPFFILSKLATLLFPGFSIEEVEPEIKKSVLSLLGYPSDSIDYHPPHVLGLVHSFITLETKEVYQINDVIIDMDSGKIDEKQLKLKRCATKLKAAGVKIKPTERKNHNHNPARLEERIRFDLKIIFSNGKLRIPPLHITETTEAKWRNFIAWELTRSPYSKSNNDIQEDGILGCKFIWYALFFQGLICSVHDIQLLRDKEVIVVHDAERSSLDSKGEKKKIMSNEDLLIFFRNITKGVRDDQIVKDSQFNKLFQDLTSSYRRHSCWVTVTSRILWHFCRRVLTAIWCFCRDSYKILRLKHITSRWKLIVAVAATLTFALTFIQTFKAFYPSPSN